MPLQYSSTQVGFPNPQSDTRMRSTPGGFQWGTRSQFHTQQLTPFSRSRYYQLQFLKSSLQSNRHQTAESLANPESCKFNELLLSTLKVFPYFTIVIDTSGAEADGYFSTMYFCNESPGANSKTAVRESRVAQRKRAGPITPRSDGLKPSSPRQNLKAANAMNCFCQH